MKKCVLWILVAVFFCAVTYGGCGGSSSNLAIVDPEESEQESLPTNDDPVPESTGSKVDLSTLTKHYTAQSGDTLTGRLYRDDLSIHIADGATVTLKDVSIENGSYGYPPRYGIYCQGNATLILEGTNVVKGASFQGSRRSGIYVKEGNTLTIMGSGSLTAQGDGGGAPGIGAGYTLDRITGMSNTDCGNIVIDGGTVNAIGGDGAPGIGSSNGTHGNITITNNVSRVAVTAGNYAKYSIGSLSYQSDSGTITIGGVVTEPTTANPFIYEP